MRILSLDLSTKTGWALFENGKLLCFGQIKTTKKINELFPDYPYNYLALAKDMASEIKKKVLSSNPHKIIIEETNKGKNRYSQKILEFIHNEVIEELLQYEIHYMDTSEWRKLLGITLDKEQRKDNREINSVRKNEFDRHYLQALDDLKINLQTDLAGAKNKREENKIKKNYESLARDKAKKIMKSFRYKENGKVKGKIGTKQLSVAFVNEHFNFQFKLKDNDIADAICVGLSYLRKQGV